MINAAIFRKTFLDSLSTLVLSCIGILGFVILIVYAMLNMGTQVLEFVSKIGFMRKIFEATLGINVEGDVSINTLFSISFTHGMVLMLTWGTIIATATRVTVGEIEKGTADLLLTLPVTRTEIFFSVCSAWILIAMLLSLCPLAGVAIGMQVFETDEVIQLSRYFAPTINFFAINVAIGGAATLVGCIMNRRAPAVGFIVAVAFVSVVLNFIEPFLPSMNSIRYLGLLNYFRPVDIVRTGDWPFSSIVVLVSVAVFSCSVGLWFYNRRDIPTA